LLKPVSEKFAESFAERVLDFRQGLNTVSTVKEFGSALGISLVMWAGIAVSYLMSARAFVAEPTLAHLTFTAIMLVLATSLGGSLLQLPILGWFTQIGVNAFALHEFFNVPIETATACAAVMLFVATLDIIPLGLIAARVQGISLRDAVSEGAAVG
jgi:glycosyltransferase 2 family protein